MLGNIIIIAIVVLAIGGAITKIVVDRKNGIKCTGCPHSKTCGTATSCSGRHMPIENVDNK